MAEIIKAVIRQSKAAVRFIYHSPVHGNCVDATLVKVKIGTIVRGIAKSEVNNVENLVGTALGGM